ncbi:MAG: hypothetical protein GF329_03405 [Candidatus Lokiarchaeota archaeon]|nr:hypothetical protein [Candidatus Lokiarchaeota archaeon]
MILFLSTRLGLQSTPRLGISWLYYINPKSEIVDPGETVQYQIEIENTGSTSSAFNLELVGLNPSISYTLTKTSTDIIEYGEKRDHLSFHNSAPLV